MEPVMKVTITKEHVDKGRYLNNYGCPLFLAIREQYPEFPLYSVGGTYVEDTGYNTFVFNTWDYNTDLPGEPWNSQQADLIREGSLESVTVYLFPRANRRSLTDFN